MMIKQTYNRQNKWIWRLLAVSCLTLTGCSVFSPPANETNSTYMIDSVPQVAVARAHQVSIAVATPTALSIYNTTDMAYTPKPYQIGYYVKNNWAATPAQMLHPLLVQTLQNTQHFVTVSSGLSTGHYDFIVNTDILQFQQDYISGKNIFRLRLRVQLTQTQTNRLLLNKDINIALPASRNTPYDGVVAANQAVQQALAEVARLCLLNT